jgi:hypothetical protein
MCVIFNVPYNFVFPVPVAQNIHQVVKRYVNIYITQWVRYGLHNKDVSYPGTQQIIESDYTIGHF